MKRFFKRLCLFFIIIVACDIAIGYVCNYLVAHAIGGDTMKKNNIVNKINEEVLIFGSSRAVYHYDPNIMEDIFNMTVYNCGFEGNGIICAYGYFKMIEKRYSPKMIIYEITPAYDYLGNDNHTYLGQLKYFYDRPYIDSMFWSVDRAERYKMISMMYRFNSRLLQLFMENIFPLSSYNKGYRPIDGNLQVYMVPKEDIGQKEYTYDSLKLYYMEKLINDCKDKTALVFVVSPIYKKWNNVNFLPMQLLCDKYGIPLISHYADTSFTNNKKYFRDFVHLNRYGATEYSEVVAREIKQLMEQQ